MIRLSVQTEDFDAGAELARLEELGGGGVASFIGIVRADGALTALQLDHYPGMTEAEIRRIASDAMDRWPLLGLTIIHRHGVLGVGARIVFVGAASVSRVPALAATAFLMDWLKVSAPFWKREIGSDGAGRWVEAKGEDDARAAQWRQAATASAPAPDTATS